MRAPRLPRAPGEFILRHYAGEVAYWTAGFVRKNREALPDSLKALLGLPNPNPKPNPKPNPNPKPKPKPYPPNPKPKP